MIDFMSGGQREGPHVTRSCFGCRHLMAVSIRRFNGVGDDVRTELYCVHGEHRKIGEFLGHETPDWCPFLEDE